MFLTREQRISSRNENQHLACYGVNSAAADAALEITWATIRSTTATAAERAGYQRHGFSIRVGVKSYPDFCGGVYYRVSQLSN
jgi:hypothetical protein